jgi:hypothetical protein
MEGPISISFQREPSYFHACQSQAPFVQTCTARDKETGEIIGMGTRAVRAGYFNGVIEPIGYLGDLRLDPRYRGGFILMGAYRYIQELHRDHRTKIYFMALAQGNQRALKTIASGRRGVPDCKDLGMLLTPAINIQSKRLRSNSPIEIIRGSRSLLREIVACLNRNHRRRQWAPSYTENDFSVDSLKNVWLRDFKIEDFYVARQHGNVVGVLAKWDQSAYKQTVVTNYSGRFRWLVPLFNLAAPLIGCPRYPEAGGSFRYFYASFIAINHDDQDIFRALLERVHDDHVSSNYHYFMIGLHERDPLAAVLSDFRHTNFSANLFAVYFDDGKEVLDSLDDQLVPYIELAML